MATNLPLRDDLQGLKPYESFDTKVKVRLNTNENPHSLQNEVAKSVISAIESSISGVNRYPNDQHLTLRSKLCEHLKKCDGINFEPNQILGANGSNEIMAEIFCAFGGPGRAALSFFPTYSMYPQYARDSFTNLIRVQRAEDFSIDIEKAISELQRVRPSLVLIANPNNPTGTYTPLSDICKIVEASRTVTVSGSRADSYPVIVVDEAYVDFRKAEDESAINLVNEFDNVVVVRTLSKAFSFAGVRFGFAVANETLIDSLEIVRLPYNLSTLTQSVVLAALEKAHQLIEKVEEIKTIRDDLFNFFSEIARENDAFTVAPSSANFIMAGIEGDENFPKQLHSQLLENGVMIRVVGPTGFFRVSIGTKEENEIFKEEFLAFHNDYFARKDN